MNVIQDSELVLYKALANQVKNGLVKPLNRLNAKCLSAFSKFEKQKSKFMNSETFEDLGDSSKILKTEREELISLFAIQDKLEKIVKRNEQRLEFVNARLEQMGIYNDAVDKKTLSSVLSSETKNVSEESLNLNPKSRENVTYKYFSGEILAFRDDELDFNLDENRDVLINCSADFLYEVINTFPYAVATISKEYYLIANFKNKVLRVCILYCAARLKTKSFAECNKELGGLLENVVEISSITQFASELKNYFNVIVKNCIKEQAPELADEVDETLTCNDSSIFLPRELRVSKTYRPVQKTSDGAVESLAKNEYKEFANGDDKKEDVSKEELLDLLINDDSAKKKENLETDNADESDLNIDADIEQTLKEIEALLNDELKDDDDNKEE